MNNDESKQYLVIMEHHKWAIKIAVISVSHGYC